MGPQQVFEPRRVRRRLRNEVALVLVLKALGLYLLFLLFFAGHHAEQAGPPAVAQHLLQSTHLEQ